MAEAFEPIFIPSVFHNHQWAEIDGITVVAPESADKLERSLNLGRGPFRLASSSLLAKASYFG
jgi:hypothetical protein